MVTRSGLGWALVAVLLGAGTVGAQLPSPSGLRAVPHPDHSVTLDWVGVPAEAPVLVEEFEDGSAEGWTFHRDWLWEVSDGALRVEKPEGTDFWYASAFYGDQLYEDVELEVEARVLAGGPNIALYVCGEPGWFPTSQFAGTLTWVGHVIDLNSFGLDAASYQFLPAGSIPGDDTPVNPGDEPNVYRIRVENNALSLYINDTLSLSMPWLNPSTGWVGVGAGGANAVTTRFESVRITPLGDDSDPFLHYQLYRNGEPLAQVPESGYSDILPGPGRYDYTVTAVYGSGESAPSDPDSVVWADPAEYRLYETFSDLPWSGLPAGWTMQDAAGNNVSMLQHWRPDLGAGLGLLPEPAMNCRPLATVGWPDISARLLTPAFSLADVNSGTLRFAHAHHSFAPYYDEQCTIQATTDGYNWDTLLTLTGDAGAQEIEVPLDGFVGEETVYVGFFYQHFGSIAHGWAIDNVRVDVAGPGPYSFAVTGLTDTVPASGGDVLFEVSLVGQLPQAYAGVNGWLRVQIPGGQVFEPVMLETFNLPQQVNLAVQRALPVPALAPEGTYQVDVHLGYYPGCALSDGFVFYKLASESEEDVGEERLETYRRPTRVKGR